MKAPKSQVEEVLYCLLTKKSITRATMPQVLNLTARIANLRNDYGINVVCREVEVINKFGRDTSYGMWYLYDRNHALEVYKKMTSKLKNYETITEADKVKIIDVLENIPNLSVKEISKATSCTTFIVKNVLKNYYENKAK